MKIQVKIISENIDGSANVEVEYDKEGHKLLLQHGLESMLVKAIENMKGKRENEIRELLVAISKKSR